MQKQCATKTNTMTKKRKIKSIVITIMVSLFLIVGLCACEPEDLPSDYYGSYTGTWGRIEVVRPQSMVVDTQLTLPEVVIDGVTYGTFIMQWEKTPFSYYSDGTFEITVEIIAPFDSYEGTATITGKFMGNTLTIICGDKRAVLTNKAARG